MNRNKNTTFPLNLNKNTNFPLNRNKNNMFPGYFRRVDDMQICIFLYHALRVWFQRAWDPICMFQISLFYLYIMCTHTFVWLWLWESYKGYVKCVIGCQVEPLPNTFCLDNGSMLSDTVLKHLCKYKYYIHLAIVYVSKHPKKL